MSVNALLRPLGAELVRASAVERQIAADRGQPLFFDYRGQRLAFFTHHHNCGTHPLVATERTVELAIADRWLAERSEQEVIEIGAVTPYYWPHRVSRIVDPCDPHPLVTDRCPLAEVDLTDCAVLSLSTFEHIGTADYGLAPDAAALREAFDKLFSEAVSFLVTVPFGYNPRCDEFVASKAIPRDVHLTVIEHQADPPYWQGTPMSRPRWQYGNGRALAVAVLERGVKQPADSRPVATSPPTLAEATL